MRYFVHLFLVTGLAAGAALAQDPSDSQKPVSENEPITIPLTKIENGKVIKPKAPATVILDARPFFDFTMNHFENSMPIRWQDYSQTEDGFKGMLDPNHSLIARKLRVIGISPSTEVIVLGKGRAGNGEEGRIAWMLTFMGIKNVKAMNYETFQGRKTSKSSKAPWAPEVWLAKVEETVRVKKNELKKNLETFDVVDVRSKEEFDKNHLPGAKNIFWKEFLDSKGNPKNKEETKKLLSDAHLGSRPIVFYSENGVESSYPTFIVNQWGLGARNFDGGIENWQTSN